MNINWRDYQMGRVMGLILNFIPRKPKRKKGEPMAKAKPKKKSSILGGAGYANKKAAPKKAKTKRK